MSKVLVTGASGFVGWNLARALAERGDDVTCLVRKTSAVDRLTSLGVGLVYGDVTEREGLSAAVRQHQVVYHVAGVVNSLKKQGYDLVNRQGVANIAAACADQTTPPVLVVVSSIAAAGPSPKDRLRTEADPCAPVSIYGGSKRAGELEAEKFADRVPTTVVRPPIVLGKADRNGLPLFTSIARFRVHLVPGWTAHRFSVIDADDLAQLLILAAERGTRLKPGASGENSSPSGYYFGASDVHPTYGELGRMIGRTVGRPHALVIPFAIPLVWVVAGFNELLSHIIRRPIYLNLDKAREATAGSWACSCQAAEEELGYRVGATLAQRIEETAAWYRDHSWM